LPLSLLQRERTSPGLVKFGQYCLSFAGSKSLEAFGVFELSALPRIGRKLAVFKVGLTTLIVRHIPELR